MQTVVKSLSGEAKIDTEGTLTIIGERINPSGSKRLYIALQDRDFGYICELAEQQISAGADILDVNVGAPDVDEVGLLPEVVSAIVSCVDVPICIDSSNSRALSAALGATKGKVLVNSVTGEEASLASVLPIVKDRGLAVIGLTLDDKGIPDNAATRVSIAGKILDRAMKIGINREDVMIDPLVLTVGSHHRAGAVTLETIVTLKREFGVNINIGASNISYGLPGREILNRTFLAVAAQAGVSCVITDPQQYGDTIRAIDLLRGRDPYARRYINYLRKRTAK
jgi:5-methyltetrahydrofolate--homocysteine methyltransferase